MHCSSLVELSHLKHTLTRSRWVYSADCRLKKHLHGTCTFQFTVLLKNHLLLLTYTSTSHGPIRNKYPHEPIGNKSSPGPIRKQVFPCLSNERIGGLWLWILSYIQKQETHRNRPRRWLPWVSRTSGQWILPLWHHLSSPPKYQWLVVETVENWEKTFFRKGLE